jgi:lambda family phage portal protein
MFNWLRRGIGNALASFSGWLGAYNATNPRRLVLEGFKPHKASADNSLVYNRQTLVNICRHLERNTATGRALVEGMRADIVGTGIDVEPDTGDEALNKRIRDEWLRWAEAAAVDKTPLWELQNQAVGEIACAGCMLWRYVQMPERINEGLPPLAILPLEAEWFSNIPLDSVPEDLYFMDGIIRDKLGRVVAYDLINPDAAILTANPGIVGERVPAAFIDHGFEKRRALQTHGEPILAPAIERIKQEEDLVTIELQSAKNSAAMSVAITSKSHPDMLADDADPASDVVNDVPLGATVRLFPDEDIKAINMTRPNPLVKDFRGMLRGDIAASCRVPRKWLDKDYSSATFMNTRMEQLDAKRQNRHTQNWLGRHIASRPYIEVLPWILLRLGVAIPKNPQAKAKLFAHKLMPDLPDYVDPVKDGMAAIQNRGGGLTTLQDECAAKGKDWRKVIDQIAAEDAYAKEKGIVLIGSAAAAEADRMTKIESGLLDPQPGQTAPSDSGDAPAASKEARTSIVVEAPAPAPAPRLRTL